MATTNSRFPYFDPLPLRSSRRGQFRPAAPRSRSTTFPGGHSLSGLDPGSVCGPWRGGRGLSACREWRQLRFWSGRLLGWGAALEAVPPLSLFLFQQLLNAVRTPAATIPSRILDLVAAVVICLPALGGLPELTPQALGAIVQPTADKLLWRGFDLLLQTFLFGAFFLDFFDALSPHVSRNRAVSQRPTVRSLLKIYTLYCFQHHSAISAISSSGSGSRYGIRMVPLLVSYSDSLSENLSTASGPG